MSQKIHNPHDKFYKKAMENLEYARSWFGYWLPKFFADRIDLSTLILAPTELINNDYSEFATDVLYRVNLKGKSDYGYLFLLAEEQSCPDYWFSWRIFEYIFLIMSRHRKAYPKDKSLPLVVPMITYASDKKWAGPRSLMDYIPKAIQPLWQKVLLSELSVVELKDIPTEDVLAGGLSSLLMLMLKPEVRHQAVKYLNQISEAIDNLQPMHQRQADLYHKHLVEFGYYLVECNSKEDSQAIIDSIAHLVPEEVHMQHQTFAEHYLQQGLQQGVQQGLQQGVQQGLQQGVQQGLQQGILLEKKKSISKLQRKGQSVAQIAEWLDLEAAEVQKILAEVKKEQS